MTTQWPTTMSDYPLVSIIISSYNYDKYLRSAIDSALNQTYAHREVIVVDDGSTDRSRDLISTYGNQIIPVFKLNGGHSSTFNSGLAASSGEIICFLDADDIFALDKIEKIVSLWAAHPHIGWCFHALELFDTTTGNSLGTTRAFPSQSEDDSRYCDFRKAIQLGKLSFYPPSTSGICVARSLFSKITPIPEALQIAGDRYIANSLMLLSPGYFLKMPITQQGIHDSNAATMKLDPKGQQRLGRNAMATAYYLRAKFPSAWKFSHCTFARGYALSRKYGFASEESKQLHHNYLQSVSLIEKIVIFFISWYQSRPWKKHNLYQANSVTSKKAN